MLCEDVSHLSSPLRLYFQTSLRAVTSSASVFSLSEHSSHMFLCWVTEAAACFTEEACLLEHTRFCVCCSYLHPHLLFYQHRPHHDFLLNTLQLKLKTCYTYLLPVTIMGLNLSNLANSSEPFNTFY